MQNDMNDSRTNAHGSTEGVPAADIVERLRNHVNNRGGASLQNGAWQMMLDAADEIERTRNLCITREEFIASKNLWGEFGAYIRDNPSLDEMVAGITEENLHGEVGTGPAVGNEVAQ